MLAAQKSHAEMWERTRIIETLFLEGNAENKRREHAKAHQTSVTHSASPSWPSLAGGHLLRVADPRLWQLGNITWAGKNVFKFSEHFPLALSIYSYHFGVGTWQELELTYTKLCMSWSQPRSLCHCHVKLHHSWPLSACAHDTCQKLSSVCSFLHQECLVSLDKEGMTFGMREEWAVPSSFCLLHLSVWVFSQHIKV